MPPRFFLSCFFSWRCTSPADGLFGLRAALLWLYQLDRRLCRSVGKTGGKRVASLEVRDRPYEPSLAVQSQGVTALELALDVVCSEKPSRSLGSLDLSVQCQEGQRADPV